jgi:alpha-glucosidase
MRNSTDRRFLRTHRCLPLLVVILLLSGVATAEWESIGNLKPAERKSNEFTFRGVRATVVIQVLAPDLIRVRTVHATSLPPDHSYAVVKTDWPPVKVDFSNDGKYQRIRTEQLEARVQLSPLRVAFYDAKGALLSKDSDTQGIAWNGDRVRVWKWEPADEHYFGFGEKSTPLDKRGRSLVMWNRDPEGFDASSERSARKAESSTTTFSADPIPGRWSAASQN